jgi:hypothetical protein
MRLCLVLFALLVAGCRDPLPLPSPGDGAAAGDDLLRAPVDCRTKADCFSCCTAEGQSGALAFTAAVQQCACQESTCKSACRQTVCGAVLGVDRACRDCIAGTLGDGGACTAALRECVETAGACGGWRSCVDGC